MLSEIEALYAYITKERISDNFKGESRLIFQGAIQCAPLKEKSLSRGF